MWRLPPDAVAGQNTDGQEMAAATAATASMVTPASSTERARRVLASAVKPRLSWRRASPEPGPRP